MPKTFTPPKVLNPEETLLANEAIQQSLPNKQTVGNYFQKDFIIFPFYNHKLKRLHDDDEQILEQYDRQRLVFPV